MICKIDKVIMTAGWDKVIRAYDELHPESVELLRCIECAHDNDINAMAHSRALSLIATGDENGALILWDFQFFSHEADCRYGAGGNNGITALTFVEDYPLLVSGDVEGNVEFWLTKPWLPSPGDESVPWNRNEVVHCITPQKGYAVPVSSLRVITAEHMFSRWR